jgi:pyruvate/2-oxoglutarate dehydrogenase complex dihydrolipoamide acyltransferase (E2) component
MAIFKVGFSMANVQSPSDSFDPLPPGEYLCEILAADVKNTATAGRNQIAVQLRVVEPSEYANRRIFDRRNLPVESEGPESFVAQRLRELFDAVPGSFDFETGEGNTDMMLGQTVCVKTRNENRKNKDGTVIDPPIIDCRVLKMYAPQSGDVAETPAAEVAETPAEEPKKAAPAPKPAAAKPPAAKPAAPKAAAPAAKPAAAAAPTQRSPFRRPGLAS